MAGKRLKETFLCALRAQLWNVSEQMRCFLGGWKQNKPLIVLHELSEHKNFHFSTSSKANHSVWSFRPLLCLGLMWEHGVTSYLLCSVSLTTLRSLFWLFFPYGAWIASCYSCFVTVPTIFWNILIVSSSVLLLWKRGGWINISTCISFSYVFLFEGVIMEGADFTLHYWTLEAVREMGEDLNSLTVLLSLRVLWNL